MSFGPHPTPSASKPRFSKLRITRRHVPAPSTVLHETEASTSLCLDTTEVKYVDSHSKHMLSGLEVLWRQHLLCDVTLLVGSHRFRAHRLVLATCAGYFNSIFTTGADDQGEEGRAVTIEGILPSTAESMLECMYTGQIGINEGNVRDLLAASAYLQFYAIEQACGEFLTSRLNKANSLRMLSMATTYNLPELEEASMRLAAENFTELADGFDFQQLDIKQILSLLARDEISCPELEIFQRALSWLQYDKSSRSKHAVDLMSAIRLPLLTPSVIVDHIETVDVVMAMPASQRLVKEALHYMCLPARQSILQSPRTVPRAPGKKECLLAIGGAPRLKQDPVSTEVSYYDPSTDTWGVLTQMNEPRHHLAVAVLGGFLYIAGGEQTNDQRSPLDTAYRFDPRTSQWLQIASMRHRRESFTLAVLGGMLYAVGGRVDADQSLAAVERYNPAVDSWELVAPLSLARRSIAVAPHNGRLYAMGGSGHKRISSKVERYNPLLDQWETRRPLTMPRFFSMLVPIANKLYLFGGATVDGSGSVICVRKTEFYTPSTDQWTTVSGMLEPRAEAGFTVMGGEIFVIGGYSWDSGQRLTSVEAYNVIKDTWRKVTDTKVPYTGVGGAALTIYHFPAQDQIKVEILVPAPPKPEEPRENPKPQPSSSQQAKASHEQPKKEIRKDRKAKNQPRPPHATAAKRFTNQEDRQSQDKQMPVGKDAPKKGPLESIHKKVAAKGKKGKKRNVRTPEPSPPPSSHTSMLTSEEESLHEEHTRSPSPSSSSSHSGTNHDAGDGEWAETDGEEEGDVGRVGTDDQVSQEDGEAEIRSQQLIQESNDDVIESS